jgi:F0F1-type ATP synthase assembly protein I
MPPNQSFYARLGRLSAIIMILPASMAAGWIIGYAIVDRLFDLFPWGSIVLTLAGAGAGFYEIVRLLMTTPGGEKR